MTDQTSRLALVDNVDLKLTSTGEKERLRRLLREKLEECGWVEAVTQKCREVAAAHGDEPVSAEQLAREIRAFGRRRVPDFVKADLLQRLRSAILG